MAKANTMTSLQLHIRRALNYIGYFPKFIKRKNPIGQLAKQILAVKELFFVQQKLKRIQNRINYEKYKLKKTELILAQNQDHLFIKGRKINQIR